MIKEVTGLEILTDKGHSVYKPKKGAIERLLKIGSHAIPPPPDSDPSGAQGPSSSHGPSTHAGPSSSHGPPRAPKKKGVLNFLSKSLFACFNVGKHLAERSHEMDKQLLKLENRQKDIMAKLDMPHSPFKADDFPQPPVFYNPWEELGGPSMTFGDVQGGDDDDIEEDLGGGEESTDDADDVPAAHTPGDADDDE